MNKLIFYMLPILGGCSLLQAAEGQEVIEDDFLWREIDCNSASEVPEVFLDEEEIVLPIVASEQVVTKAKCSPRSGFSRRGTLWKALAFGSLFLGECASGTSFSPSDLTCSVACGTTVIPAAMARGKAQNGDWGMFLGAIYGTIFCNTMCSLISGDGGNISLKCIPCCVVCGVAAEVSGKCDGKYEAVKCATGCYIACELFC